MEYDMSEKEKWLAKIKKKKKKKKFLILNDIPMNFQG